MEVRIGVVCVLHFILHSLTSSPGSLFFLPGDPGNEVWHSLKLCLGIQQLHLLRCVALFLI